MDSNGFEYDKNQIKSDTVCYSIKNKKDVVTILLHLENLGIE